jgi:tRNA(fMet)-specific endonuclease VapC
MNYLVDTNVVLLGIRNDTFNTYLHKHYLSFVVNPIISVVSIAELRSIAIRNVWGQSKYATLEKILKSYLVADINTEDIIQRYAEIDNYSQGKLPTHPSSFTARNMGKNDLWIAATASVLGATLLTTDNDFLHLQSTFLDIEQMDYKTIIT